MNASFSNRFSETTANKNFHQGIERLFVSVVINSVLGLAIFSSLKSLGIPTLFTVILTLLLFVTGVIIITRLLPIELNGIRKRKPLLSVLWLLIAFVSVFYSVRLTVFMVDPTQTQYSLFPTDKWMVEHCCLTAYSESALLTSSKEKNIYKSNFYIGPDSLVKKNIRRKIESKPESGQAGFTVDNYHYPPPFLLLPIVTRFIVNGNFIQLRMLWYALSVLSLMAALFIIYYRMDNLGRLRLLGMAPLILWSMPVLSGLQMSNVQIIVISISIIAMALFQINKPLGGLLLAMSSVAKIFPGILFVYLIVQRKFKEGMQVILFAIVLSLIAFVVVGSNPFEAFINYELPRLSSGEAFAGPFSREFAVARNMAPFGIPLKLALLGVPGMTLGIGRIVSSVHLFMVLLLAIWAGRQKPRTNAESISVWISLIALSSLVSPFAPANYVLVSVVLLVCINRDYFPTLLTIIIWLIICLPFLISREAPVVVQVLAHLPAQFIAIAAPAFVLYRAGLRSVVIEKELSNASVVQEV